MRRTLGLIALALGASLVVAGSSSAKGEESSVLVSKSGNVTDQEVSTTDEPSETPPGVVVRTHEDIEVTSEERQRAIAAQQKASAEEQQVQSRLRGLQVLMQKEEEALAQRLAYAAKIREQGLTKNDQQLLDQAEQYERQALDYYQKRVQQFEKASISVEPVAVPQSAVPKQVAPQPRNKTATTTRQAPVSRSTSRNRTTRR